MTYEWENFPPGVGSAACRERHPPRWKLGELEQDRSGPRARWPSCAGQPFGRVIQFLLRLASIVQ